MKRVAKEWDSYRREVVPADAHPSQAIETRRAFYAGARAMLTLLLVFAATTGPDDVTAMDDVKAELNEFSKLVTAGVA